MTTIALVIAAFVGLLAYIISQHQSNSQERKTLLSLIENSSDAVIMADYEGKATTFCNPQNAKASALIDSFNAGNDIYSWIDAQSRKNLQQEIESMKRSKKIRQIRLRLMNDGQDYDVTLCPGNGSQFYMIAHSQTVSTKQLKKLQDKAQLMELLLDNLPIPLSIKDMTNRGTYLAWNKKAEILYGAKREDIVGNTPSSLSPNISQAFTDTDREAMMTGDCETKRQIKLDDGKLHTLALFKKLVTSHDGHKWIASAAIDQTEQELQRQQLEIQDKNLQQALIKAAESNRLKSEFIANISHEIRTPLNAIVGFSEYMADTDDQAERQMISKNISENANALVDLIDGILELAQIETGERKIVHKPTNITQLVKEVMNGGTWVNRPSLSSELKMPEQEYVIDTNHDALTCILNNFLSNAIKYTPSGLITVGYVISLHHVRIFVKDTGIGIPHDKLAKIFERFEKNGSTQPGIGLGLTICKALTAQMGGQIGVDSKEKQGSTFWIELPCSPRPAGA